MQQSFKYFAVLLIVDLIQDGSAVLRPDYLSRARLAPRSEEIETPVVKNKDPSGLKIYVGPNYKDPISKIATPPVMTSGKCCKIGERVAKEGMHCKLDMYMASKSNHVYRSKFRPVAEADGGRNEYIGMMAAVHKGLTLKVPKCYQHKDMFEKCCNYRTSFLSMMKKCKNLKGPDKKQCRTKTRKSFGY